MGTFDESQNQILYEMIWKSIKEGYDIQLKI